MEKLSRFECRNYREAASDLGIGLWRLRYAVESSYIEEPSVVQKRRRLFAPQQLEEMKRYFDEENAHRQERAQRLMVPGGTIHQNQQ